MASSRFDEFNSQLEDFSTYIERLEQFFIVNETKSELKAPFLLTVIGRKTFGILKDLLLPESPSSKSYDQLVTILTQHFAPVRITIAERFKFYKRTQRPGETISDYLLELKHLAATCNFGNFLPEALRDAFVCGLYNENIQKRLLSEHLTLEEANKIALAMELASKETYSLHHPQTATNYISNTSLPHRSSMKPSLPPPSKHRHPSCKRCGRTDHSEDKCPAKQWTCFNCKRTGHTSKMCRRIKGVSIVGNESFRQNNALPEEQTSPQGKDGKCSDRESDVSEEINVFTLSTLESSCIKAAEQRPLVVEMQIEDVSVPMEIDTGAAVSLLPASLYDRSFSKIPMHSTDVKLKSVVGESINVQGEISVRVYPENQHCQTLSLLVVHGINVPLMGRNWISILLPKWRELLQQWTPTTVDTVNSLAPKTEEVDPFIDQLWHRFPQVLDTTSEGSELVVADALSRNPVPDVRESTICSFSFCSQLPVTSIEVASATEQDPMLKELLHYTIHGWPSSVPSPEWKPYWSRKHEMTAEQGCLLWGNRVIVPKSLQSRVIQELHESHPGIVRMKMLARSYFWWPGLEVNIEECTKNCMACQLQQSNPPRTVGTWATTSKPWERIHLDFAHLQGYTFLIITDAFTRWIDLYLVQEATSQTAIEKLRNSITYFGLPKSIVADNGTPFVSSEFKVFCVNNAIELVHTPTYHPSSNGSAERAVRTIKSALKKLFLERPGEQPQLLLDEVLFGYRNTPCTVTGVSPAEMIYRYKPRIKLDIMKPDREKGSQQNQSSGVQNRFSVGERVLVRSTRRVGTTKWEPGQVIVVKSPLTYLVSVSGRTRFVHLDHLRSSRLPSDGFAE